MHALADERCHLEAAYLAKKPISISGKDCDCQGRLSQSAQRSIESNLIKPARASTAVSTICPASLSIIASGSAPLLQPMGARDLFRHAKVNQAGRTLKKRGQSNPRLHLASLAQQAKS